jgi:Uma2 family endonuclease
MVAPFDRLTPDEYLEAERHSEIRHEYFDGQVIAMGGASSAHGLLVTNLIALLRPKVRGTGCQLFSSDMKVKLATRNRFFYPDLLLTGDPRDRDNDDFVQYPKLVIEVLSESTEAFDRGVKFRDYGELTSLEEYVLVSQHEGLVERFTRKGDGSWRLDRYANDDRLHLESLDCMIDLDAVYEDVTLSTERGDA